MAQALGSVGLSTTLEGLGGQWAVLKQWTWNNPRDPHDPTAPFCEQNQSIRAQFLPTAISSGDQHLWISLGKEEPLFRCTLFPSQDFLVSVPESVSFDHTQSVGNINAEVLRVRASISHLLTLVLMDGDQVKGFFWNWFIRPRGFPSRSLLSLLRFMCLFNISSAYWGLIWKLSLRSICSDSVAETLWCCSLSWKNAPNGLRDWCIPRRPDWWWGGPGWRTAPGRRGWGLWTLLQLGLGSGDVCPWCHPAWSLLWSLGENC